MNDNEHFERSGARPQDRRGRGRTHASRFLHRVNSVAVGERAAVAVGGALLGWLAVFAIAGFPSWLGDAIQITAGVATLVMVFVVQHSQRRTEAATQLKLDELIRVTDADNRLAEIEADDNELERRRRHRTEQPPSGNLVS